ncbi:MAG: TPMT family class I SAM-dependent methyltransferase [Flavobacteriales bacterium]|jgi:thiopurine S-methyltransferase|nr:TPMT family class I SAM-dependent methyltransferase [Flavobacteriales bacterium]
MKINLNAEYWNNRYIDKTHRWDIGYPAPAITNYFDQIEDKEIRILIPGCGSAYEGEYLFNKGFKNITLLDLAEETKKSFLNRVPEFKNFHVGGFFEYKGEFDYIIEQTFFCALNPSLRNDYVMKVKELLGEKGKLVGLMFHDELYKEHPPFGGYKEDYLKLFTPHFSSVEMEITQESIKERLGRELFIEIGH